MYYWKDLSPYVFYINPVTNLFSQFIFIIPLIDNKKVKHKDVHMSILMHVYLLCYSIISLSVGMFLKCQPCYFGFAKEMTDTWKEDFCKSFMITL